MNHTGPRRPSRHPAYGTDLRVREAGNPDGPALLLLHGSGGAESLGSLPTRLAEKYHVLVPSLPGFDGTHIHEDLCSVAQLAELYGEYLDQRGLQNVAVAGFSLGGWLAMEMAVRDTGRISNLVLVDPIGVQTMGDTILNPMLLRAEEALRLNYHDATAFIAAAATASAEQRAAQAANAAAAGTYTSDGLYAPDLLPRLRTVTIPVLVIFGESEYIVPRSSGDAIIAAVAGPATFALIPRAGHRPQLEQPGLVEDEILRFLGVQQAG